MTNTELSGGDAVLRVAVLEQQVAALEAEKAARHQAVPSVCPRCLGKGSYPGVYGKHACNCSAPAERVEQEPASVQITGHLDEADAPIWEFINAEARKLGPTTCSLDTYNFTRPDGAQPNGAVAVLWNGMSIHALAVTVRDSLNRTQCVRLLATPQALPVTAPHVTAAMWSAAHKSMEVDGDLALALQEALAVAHSGSPAPAAPDVAGLVEALRSVLGWRELRSGNDFPVERIEQIASAALATFHREGWG